jgi:UPF0716 protein FxsA
MLFGKSLALVILLLPLLEIAAFVLVATQTGVLGAFALLLLASVAGAIVLRQAGRAQMTRLQAALSEGTRRLEFKDLGLIYVLVGVLLLIPGFLTDVLAILLLIPPVRRALGAAFGRVVVRRPPAGSPEVVDLDQQDWHRVPDAELPPPSGPKPPDGGPTHQGNRDRP